MLKAKFTITLSVYSDSGRTTEHSTHIVHGESAMLNQIFWQRQIIPTEAGITRSLTGILDHDGMLIVNNTGDYDVDFYLDEDLTTIYDLVKSGQFALFAGLSSIQFDTIQADCTAPQVGETDVIAIL